MESVPDSFLPAGEEPALLVEPLDLSALMLESLALAATAALVVTVVAAEVATMVVEERTQQAVVEAPVTLRVSSCPLV